MSCDEKHIIIIEKPTEVLEKPYPLSYPSSNPRPNSVVGVVNEKETVEVIKEIYGKDFLVYKIRMDDGKVGYVVYEEGMSRRK